MSDRPPTIISAQPIDLFTALKDIADAANQAHLDQVSLYRERLLCIEAAATFGLASNDIVAMRVALEDILKEAKS